MDGGDGLYVQVPDALGVGLNKPFSGGNDKTSRASFNIDYGLPDLLTPGNKRSARALDIAPRVGSEFFPLIFTGIQISSR